MNQMSLKGVIRPRKRHPFSLLVGFSTDGSKPDVTPLFDKFDLQTGYFPFDEQEATWLWIRTNGTIFGLGRPLILVYLFQWGLGCTLGVRFGL